MVAGMKKGEMRPGPRSSRLLVFALDDFESADAAADVDARPARRLRASLAGRPSPVAKSDAAMANWMKRPIFLISLRLDVIRRARSSLTSPAIWQANAVASKAVMRADAALAFADGLPSSVPCRSRPEESRPTPVTTTLRGKVRLPQWRRCRRSG